MADEAVTAADVDSTGGIPTTEDVIWGEDGITAGMFVTKDTADNDTWKKGLTTSAAGAIKAGSGGVGISLNGGDTGQPGKVCTKATTFDPGFTVTVGTRYYGSKNNAGGVMPHTDLASTNYVVFLGIGTAAANLLLNPIYSGAQVP